ncbi:MAG: hypothetical protein Q8L46_02140 [candidate division WWE3 bacterium]|nr:hypothetical protein [candidate division WWE3 bacterium]
MNPASKTNFKIIILVVASALGGLGLGIALERIFALGFTLDIALWLRFLPLLLFFMISSTFLTILSLTAPALWRGMGIVLASMAFGLPFFLPPHPVEIPLLFAALLPLFFGAGALALCFYARRAVRIFSIFAARIFASAYTKFFLFFILAVGVLVYFSAQLPPPARFTIPEEILTPSLNLIVNRVIEQVQGELGTTQFTEEQFLAELEKSGLLDVLNQQFGFVLKPQDVSSPQKLAENLRQPLVEQLTKDLEDFLGPYLPFLPLAAAAGVALSLLFLTPVFAWLAVGFFAITYRILVWLRFARFEQEQRQVPTLKII